MGRNKFSQSEIDSICKLLRRKNGANRYQQKLIRHDLRVNYDFNISDFNVQGQAFGEKELQRAIQRGAIRILDDATIAAMKEKYALRCEQDRKKVAEAEPTDPSCDWQQVVKEWEEYYGKQEEDA